MNKTTEEKLRDATDTLIGIRANAHFFALDYPEMESRHRDLLIMIEHAADSGLRNVGLDTSYMVNLNELQAGKTTIYD